jgi:Ca-activated chloride channel family protein
MNATILDRNGSHVSGLKKAQFSIFEDGVEQQIDFFEAEETPFAAVILLDSSGSMEERVSLARAAAIRFLDGLRISDSAAIYRFDSKVVLVQDFSNSRDVTEKIFDVKSYGMTVLNDAVYKAAKDLETRPEKRRAIIVLSDGADTMSGRSADAALKAALAANAVIYTVDMSSPESSAKQKMESAGALKKFAEKSGGTYVSTPGGIAMREAFEKIVTELGVQYTLGFSPLNLKKDGKWRELEMRIARPNLTIRTRKGYHAVKAK